VVADVVVSLPSLGVVEVLVPVVVVVVLVVVVVDVEVVVVELSLVLVDVVYSCLADLEISLGIFE
jgi:hypothetical protein